MFGLGKKRFQKNMGGVLPGHFKNTAEDKTVEMPAPDRVSIVMAQFAGAPCQPTVKVGQEVKVGTVIGQSEGRFGSLVHASISGKVTGIENIILPNSLRTVAVVITGDGEMAMDENIAPPTVDSRDSFVEAVRQSGLMGLGGAGFPTWVKLSPPKEIDTLIINGAECEPFLTSDYREMMEKTEDVLAGVKLVKKYLGIPRAVIAVEDNKPAAIAALREKADDEIEILEMVSRYPQGAEKVLVKEITNREVPRRGLPADVGALVMNVSTVSFINQYLKDGVPLIKKRITVDGDCVAHSVNVIAAVGTPIGDIAEFCGGYTGSLHKILLGGPMMGMCVYTDNYPVAKNTNGLLFMGDDLIDDNVTIACMKCGRCANACPMRLMPPQIYEADKSRNWEDLEKLQADVCMECGCCSYVCPSKRPVTHQMRMAKHHMALNRQKKQEVK